MEENKDLNQQEEKVETEETVNDDAFTKTVESLKSAVEDAFKSCKDECGTVSDLGVAPIMPVGSSIFPLQLLPM